MNLHKLVWNQIAENLLVFFLNSPIRRPKFTYILICRISLSSYSGNMLFILVILHVYETYRESKEILNHVQDAGGFYVKNYTQPEYY